MNFADLPFIALGQLAEVVQRVGIVQLEHLQRMVPNVKIGN